MSRKKEDLDRIFRSTFQVQGLDLGLEGFPVAKTRI